jgi:hypothetical protein
MGSVFVAVLMVVQFLIAAMGMCMGMQVRMFMAVGLSRSVTMLMRVNVLMLMRAFHMRLLCFTASAFA